MNTTTLFAAWIFLLMSYILPPAKAAAVPTRPEGRETAKERTERYREIAHDIATVVLDEPPLYRSKHGRARTAALIVAVAYFESAFAKHVDKGIGPYSRGDYGRSWCMLQLNVGRGKTAEGWTGKDLVNDRRKCIRAGLHAMARSFGTCRRGAFEHRLAAYASGSCRRGHAASAKRMRAADRIFGAKPPPKLPAPKD